MQSEYNNKVVKNEDIKALVKDMATLISNLIGKDIRKKFKIAPLNEKGLQEKLNRVIKEINELDKKTSSATTFKEKISIFKTFCRTFATEAPKDVDILEWIMSQLDPRLQISNDIKLSKNTNYLNYVNTLEKLAQEIYEREKDEPARAFLQDFKKSEDSYILGQSVFKSIDNYKHLQKKFRRIRKSHVEKCIRIYSDLSGDYEKQLRIIVGLLKLLRTRDIPRYQSIRSRGLYNNITMIEEEKDYLILVEGFDRIIRNSIAHNSYVFDVIKKEIKFVDRENRISLSYTEFVGRVRELNALVWALHLIHAIFMRQFFLDIKVAFDQVSRSVDQSS